MIAKTYQTAHLSLIQLEQYQKFGVFFDSFCNQMAILPKCVSSGSTQKWYQSIGLVELIPEMQKFFTGNEPEVSYFKKTPPLKTMGKIFFRKNKLFSHQLIYM